MIYLIFLMEMIPAFWRRAGLTAEGVGATLGIYGIYYDSAALGGLERGKCQWRKLRNRPTNQSSDETQSTRLRKSFATNSCRTTLVYYCPALHLDDAMSRLVLMALGYYAVGKARVHT